MKNRDYRIDNIKFVLIFCVVLGHLCELFDKGGLYKVIYSFHIPVFIFVSGYLAKFNSGKIIKSLIVPYCIFQVLYLLFVAIVIKGDIASLKIQFTKPYWLMWYMLALVFYYLLIPFLKVDYKYVYIELLGVSIISLLSGFDDSIGYYMSLSRFFTFLPYFVLGMNYDDIKNKFYAVFQNKKIRLANIVVVLCIAVFMAKNMFISNDMLYGSYSYNAAQYSIWIKALLLMFGINWCYFFMEKFPNIKIPIISMIGKNTLPIFLLHGFIKKYLALHGGVFVYTGWINYLIAVLLSVIILIVLGNNFVARAFRYIFNLEWIGVQSKGIVA